MKPLTTTFASSALAAGGYALGSLGLGPIGFALGAAPVVLGATGAALPPLWNILSSLPPKPLLKYFPGISLMFNISTEDMKPITMPPWQKALRLGIVTSAALAAATPDYKSNLVSGNDEPVILFVNNGWASAPDWELRASQMEILVRAAEKKNRPVVIIPGAKDPAALEDETETQFYTLTNAEYAETLLPEITANSWPINYEAHIAPLKALQSEIAANYSSSSVYWLSDGLVPESADFIDTLQSFGDLHIIKPDAQAVVHLLSLERMAGESLVINVTRANSKGASTLELLAMDIAGRPVQQETVVFEEGQTEAQADFKVPPEIRASLSRVVIADERHAGTTLLLDENWRQRSVGVIETGLEEALLDGSNFVAQAIRHNSAMQRGSVTSFIEDNVSVITWTDEAVLTTDERLLLKDWVAGGGTLIRFAGDNLAAQPNDDLIPVKLRSGVRSPSGAFNELEGGQSLTFPTNSTLSDMAAPENLSIDYIVLPEADPDLASFTLASLENGLPLITGRKEGEGQLILIHTSANTNWSNLPMTGEFFLNLMDTLVNSGTTAENDKGLKQDMPPLLTMNANGELQRAPSSTKALTQETVESHRMDEGNPPGYYGTVSTRVASNVSDAVSELKALDDVPETISVNNYSAEKETDYASLLFIMAFMGMIADLALSVRRAGKPGDKISNKKIQDVENDIKIPGLD